MNRRVFVCLLVSSAAAVVFPPQIPSTTLGRCATIQQMADLGVVIHPPPGVETYVALQLLIDRSSPALQAVRARATTCRQRLAGTCPSDCAFREGA